MGVLLSKKKKLIIAGVAIAATLGFGGLATAASASETPTDRPGHSTEYNHDGRHQNGNDGIGNGNDVDVDVPVNVQIWDTLKNIL